MIRVAISIGGGEVLLAYSTQTPPRVGEYVTVYEPYDPKALTMGARRMRVRVKAIEHPVQVERSCDARGEPAVLLGFDLIAHAVVVTEAPFTEAVIAREGEE